MKKIFLIELHPINKAYFKDVYSGYINESYKVDDARHFKSYEEAQKELHNIVVSDYDYNQTLYLSIVNFVVKKQDQ